MGLKSNKVSINDDVDSWNKTLLDISTSTKNHDHDLDQDQEQQQQQQQQQNKTEPPLDCPRCGSMNTKFCYYNNYNKFQPRHFCKACKRYWTKGGTLRNVPVGCGRKNKRLKTVVLNSPAKTTTTTIATVPVPTSTTANNNPDHQDYCNIYNLHLPAAQQGLKAVTDNDEKNISDFLFETFSVDSASPQDGYTGNHNLSFSGGFHFNGNPSPITSGIYDCSSSQQLENIISTSSSSITENYTSGNEWINWWNMNDLDTLISADDLNYVPWEWDDDAAKEINPLN